MALPDFHEVLFPEDISYGSNGGPRFNTTVIELSSGYEQRNINWSEVKASYEATHGIKTREQMEALQDFFYARRGKAYGFRYKDWADYQIEEGVVFQAVNPNTFGDPIQLFKRYEPLTSFFYDRPIKKFVPGSLDGHFYIVNSGGVRTTLDDSSWTLDYNTGLWTGPNLPYGMSLFVDYIEFHVPCRFDIDEMKINQDDWETMSWPSIPLVELKLR